MLNELLARVQAHADDRNLGMHHGTLKRTVYSAEDILDGQSIAISIHFDRDTAWCIKMLADCEPTWAPVWRRKITEIDALAYDLAVYRRVYKHLVSTGMNAEGAIIVLSNERLVHVYKKHFEALRDLHERQHPKDTNLFEGAVCDIEILLSLKH
jgi:hypothetical protein